MTLPTCPNPPLPVGADRGNSDLRNWMADGSVPLRLVWSEPMPEGADSGTEVLIVASQRTDGTFIVDDTEGPFVYVNGAPFTLDQAARLTRAVSAAMNLAGRWVGKSRKEIDRW